MSGPWKRVWAGVVLAAAVALGAAPAIAQSSDRGARKAGERAMNEKFGAADFEGARQDIEGAIAGCKGQCTSQTLAFLHMSLGIVWVTGFNDSEHAKAEMDTARTLDPAIQPDPVWSTPEVKAAFAASGKGRVKPVDVVLDDDSAKKAKKKRHHVEEEEPKEPQCSSDGDCDGGRVCQAGTCAERPLPPHEPGAWLGLGLIQDIAFVSGSDACSRESQVSGGFTCLRRGGSQYHGTPLRGGGGDASGAAFASTRVTLSSDFRISGPVSMGLRMGYVFAGQGPQPDGGKDFIWLHAELRGAYWFTGSALSTDQVGFFAELSGGVAEIDGSTSVTVKEDTTKPPPASQIDNPPVQQLDAYQKMGSGFVAPGVGVFVPLGSRVALTGDLRGSILFPTSGFALNLGVGLMFGL